MALNTICVGVGNRNRMFLCMWDGICIFIGIVIFSPHVYIFHSGARSEVLFQNRQVIVTFLGCRSR